MKRITHTVTRTVNGKIVEHKSTTETFYEIPGQPASFDPGSVDIETTAEYPHPSGEVVVLGPETFIDYEKNVICHKGENYYLPQELAVAVPVDGPLRDDSHA